MIGGNGVIYFKTGRFRRLKEAFSCFATYMDVDPSNLCFRRERTTVVWGNADEDERIDSLGTQNPVVMRAFLHWVDVNVRDQDGDTRCVRFQDRDAPLKELFDAYGRQRFGNAYRSVAISPFKFMFKAIPVNDDDTLHSVGFNSIPTPDGQLDTLTVEVTVTTELQILNPTGSITKISPVQPHWPINRVLAEYGHRVGMPLGVVHFAPPHETDETVIAYCFRINYSCTCPIRTQVVDVAELWKCLQQTKTQLHASALQAMSAFPSYDHYHRYCKVPVQASSPIYEFISKQFHASVMAHRGTPLAISGGTGDHFRPKPILRVKHIEQVQNFRLSELYIALRNSIAGLNRPNAPAIPYITAPMVHGSTLNEYFLFHGTSKEATEKICTGGFDPRRGGTSAGKLFGVGAYFAENSSKADRYTEPAEGRIGGERQMLVARVCLGATHITATQMTTATMPPERPDGKAPLDSVTAEMRDPPQGRNGVVDFREYIVYQGAQALPEYCITYVHEQGCRCARCVP
jgi:hypothetical protein